MEHSLLYVCTQPKPVLLLKVRGFTLEGGDKSCAWVLSAASNPEVQPAWDKIKESSYNPRGWMNEAKLKCIFEQRQTSRGLSC